MCLTLVSYSSQKKEGIKFRGCIGVESTVHLRGGFYRFDDFITDLKFFPIRASFVSANLVVPRGLALKSAF